MRSENTLIRMTTVPISLKVLLRQQLHYMNDHYNVLAVSSPEKELEEAKIMAKAAKEAGLQHVIWSTLEDTRKWVPIEDDRMPTLMGKYKVPHFDAKGEADQFFIDLGVPTTFLRASFYWDNFIYFGSGPKKGPDGKLYYPHELKDKFGIG